MTERSIRLPPLDEGVLAKAIGAYRAAVEYALRVEAKWAPREDEIRKLGPFHGTSVARENAQYRAATLTKEALDIVSAVARGGVPQQRGWLAEEHTYRSKDRDFVRALRAVDEVRRAIRGSKRKRGRT